MLTRTVQDGDCISSLAFQHGFCPSTVWQHFDNVELRSLRRDPNVLMPGDQVIIPDLEPKDVEAQTEQCHRFRRRGVPEMLRIRIEDEEGKPVAKAPYEITIDGKHGRGKTDADGWVIQRIAPDARAGTLLVGPEGEEREYELSLGFLDPVDEVSGVQARLKNLGYPCLNGGVLDEPTRAALRLFQADHSLDPTGEPDEATRDRLRERHRS